MPTSIEDLLRMYRPRAPLRDLADSGLFPSAFNTDDGGMGVRVPIRPPGGTPVAPGANAPVVPQAGLMPSPSQGLPSGLGSESAGIFDAYMRGLMPGGRRTYMPPTFANVGGPRTPSGPADPTVPVMSGGDSGGDSGDGGGAPAGGAGYISDGFNTGLSNRSAALLGSLLGIPAAGLLNAAVNTMFSGGLVGGRDGIGISGPNGIGVGAPSGLSAAGVGAAGYGPDPSQDAEAQEGGFYGGDGGGSSDSGDNGSGGSGTSGAGEGGDGPGGGWARGGKVTRAGLMGPNPPGPDDGYGALDAGELVVPAKVARKLSKKQVAGLLGRR